MTDVKSADAALAELKSGNEAFVRSLTPEQRQWVLPRLAQTHAPLASILACSDSRTSPEILFTQALGDLFVIRVAGNVATQPERASLEYSAIVLNSPLIVVMGHSGCGAVEAAIELTKGKTFPGDIQALASLIAPAARETEGQLGNWLENAIQENVRMAMAHVRASGILSELIDAGRLKLVGAYHDLATGHVTFL